MHRIGLLSINLKSVQNQESFLQVELKVDKQSRFSLILQGFYQLL